MSKKAKLLLLLISAIVIFLIVNIYVTFDDSPTRREAVGGELAMDTQMSISAELYRDSGRLLQNQTQFENSSYYPFNPSSTIVMGPLKVGMTSFVKNGEITYKSYSTYGIVTLLGGDTIPLYSDNEATHKELHFYLSGAQAITSNFSEWDSDYKSMVQGTDYGLWEAGAGNKTLPTFIPGHDLPRTQRELKKYELFLEQVDGRNPLRDAWSTPIRFILKGTVLEAESAGADRIFGTKDDIVERSDSVSP